MSATTTDTSQSQSQESSTGLDQNVATFVAYLFGFLTGVIMFVVESDNEHVRFHAAQSIVVFGALFVVNLVISFIQSFIASALIAAGPGGGMLFFLSSIFGLISTAILLIIVGLWIYLLIQAYQGNDPRIPIAANFAENLVS